MQPNIPNVNPNIPMNGQNNPYYNMNKSKSNNPSQPISINELSRFGHSVTACNKFNFY
ncbi:MAG: hypothetical protein MJ252_06115 [archaeon]|nr:hypothetical protein [archaeon]